MEGYYVKGYKFQSIKLLDYQKGGLFIHDFELENELVRTDFMNELQSLSGEKMIEILEKIIVRCWSNSNLMLAFLKSDIFENNFWNKIQDIDNLSIYFQTKLDTRTNVEFSKHLSSTNLHRW